VSKKLQFVPDEKVEAFEKKMHAALAYLKKCPNHEHFQTVATMLNDNIKMHNHIKELENGKQASTNGAE